MSTANDGGPAFPCFTETAGVGSAKRNAIGEWENYVPGMSLRQWLIGQVACGYTAQPDERRFVNPVPGSSPRKEDIAKWRQEMADSDADYCVMFADSLLRAIEKVP